MASQARKIRNKPLSIAAPARLSLASVSRTEPAKDREEEFLVVALSLFAERNFASVTIKDIAEELGVNTALIYYYFKSKTDLFKASIDHAVEGAFANMRALEESNTDPANLLTAWLQNHVDKYAEIHRFVKVALDYRGAHQGDPEIEAIIASFYAKERQLLSKLIKDGIDQGMFRNVDSGRMVQLISTYLDGCMVRSVIMPDFDLKTAVADLHRNVLELLSAEKLTKAKRKLR